VEGEDYKSMLLLFEKRSNIVYQERGSEEKVEKGQYQEEKRISNKCWRLLLAVTTKMKLVAE
jgi:hypothetical protein